METVISHTDVTTIMDMLAQIAADVRDIQTVLVEDDDGEEEDPETDA
ncbi:MAG TPA: hypothetical protein VHC01_05965 [Gaiellaceae bacterium]|jgi:hypothetical protein|nr:hypothetical protein [Gaiellaceae bacterium]